MLSFSLEKDFVETYRNKQEKFGFNGLGNIVFYRTYSRIKSNGEYETWADVCERVINGMYSILQDYTLSHQRRWDYNKAQKDAQEAFDRMFNFKWTPSGRGLWMMGTPFIHERKISEALLNCFSGDTKIITKEYGSIQLIDIIGEQVTAWTSDGWKKAYINSFGKQTLYNITFAPCIGGKKLRSNVRQTYKATANHRWILVDGETTNLAVGDKVKSNPVTIVKDEQYRNGYLHGIIFGDGSKISHTYANGDYGFSLRACDEKMKSAANSVADLFDSVNWNIPTFNGDPLYFKRSNIEYKEFPDTNNSNYISGFIDGWMAADSWTTPSGSYNLGSSHPQAIEWIKNNAAIGGYILTGLTIDNRETNFGKRTYPLVKMTLNHSNDVTWEVVNIEELAEDNVYCATVPEIGNFTLSSGILTGNCAFISTKDINTEYGEIFEWIANMLMLGVGVAFDTLGAGTTMVYSPDTDLTDLYVIPDSREGWSISIKLLVNTYLYPNENPVDFDYSLIRKKGQSINGFGGIASGPEPLQLCHQRIREYLNKNCGKNITSRTIVDICNAIGACVVAGNVRRCLPYYANVQTDNGFKKICDIQIGDTVVTGGISNKVIGKIDSGKQKTLKIKHRFGSLECTPNHRVAVFSELDKYVFVEASKLSIGDRLVFDSSGIDGYDTILPPFINSEHPNATQIKFPTIVNAEFAWLIGSIQGDGYVGDGSIEISQETKYINILNKFQYIMYDSFKSWGEIRQDSKNEKMFKFRAQSVSLTDWLRENVKKSKTAILVPEYIKSSSRDVRFAYLAGLLDTDGSVRKNSTICAVSTIYIDFARQVVSLLASLGIAAKINTNNKSGYGGSVISHEVTISGRRNKVQYFSGVNQHSVSDKLSNLGNEGFIDFSYPKNMLTKNTAKNISNYHLAGSINIDKTSSSSTYLPTEILSIEYSENEVQTFDIEVENVHQFTTNGIVVHNSAELALGSVDDEDYVSLKNYSKEENQYRMDIGWSSNNSVIGNGIEDYSSVANNIYYNGEPGVVWLDNIAKYGRMGEEKYDNAIGVNPCSEIPLASREMCVSGDTYIQTRTNGVTKIKDLIGIPVEIWNGEKWANVTPFETGKNVLYRITLSDGSYLDATPNHKWLAKTKTQANMRELMTKELSVGMKLPSFSLGKSEGIFDDNAYAYGWFAGDGFMDDGTPMAVVQESEYFIAEDNNWKTYKAQHPEGYNAPFKRVTFNGVLNPENCKQLRNKTDGLPKNIMDYDNDSIANFIGGWIDADGHLAKQTNTDNYILYGTEQKIRDAQLLLRRIGVDHASIQLYAKKGEKTNFGIRNYDLWKIYIPSFECEAIKTQLKKATRFGSRIGANPRYSGVKIDHARTQKIIRIEKIADSEQTYCFFEPEKNMGVFGNVITKQCNLSEIYMHNMEDEYDFQRTIKFAYLYSKVVSLTYEWIADKKSRKIMMKNRRTGVGTTAIAQFLSNHSVNELIQWWDNGYKLIQSYDNRYSQWLGIPLSIRTTTMKPSGTISLLPGATPGAHFPHDNYYLRRVRIQEDTPMLEVLKYAGYRIEKDIYSDNTAVVEIPIHIEGQTIKDKSIWEQMQIASLVQKYWSDNAVSITISFDPTKTSIEEINSCLKLYANELKCVSMLPVTPEGKYAQMPYESITKAEYEERMAEITPIKNLAESMSIVNKMRDSFCDGESCAIT